MHRRAHDDSGHAVLVRMIGQVRRRWRARLALRGLVVSAAVLLLAFVAAALALQRLGSPPEAIAVARGLGVLLVLALIARQLVIPLLRPVADERVALYIEEHEPSLQAALLSAVEAGAHREGVSAALARRIMDDAVARCREVQYGRRIELPGLRRTTAVGGGVALAALALFLSSPATFSDAARSLFLPAASAAPAADRGALRVLVEPGDATVPRGAEQLVTARTVGFQGERVELAVRLPGDSAFQRVAMLPDSGAHRLRLFDLEGPTDYFVEADGVRSPVHRIEVVDLPYVDRLELELVFPAYTGLEPQRIEDGGDIAAVAGTRVRLLARPTRPVDAGRVVLDDGNAVELRADSAGALAGGFTVRRPGYYHVELRAAGAEAHAASPQYLIDVLEDTPPTVSFAKPGRDVKVTSVDEVFVEARAEDDFGVGSLELVYSVNGGPEQTVPLYGARPLREVSAGHTLYLEEMGLQPGDFVSYFARASDNGPARRPVVSDLYFMEIRPYGQEFRQADTRGGGQGGAEGGADAELSQRQRQVIAATFNLIRDRDGYSEKELREHLTTLTLAQDRLREQVETLTRRMLNRGVVRDTGFAKIAQILPRAAAEMRAAAEHLRAGAPDDAMPPEQRALQQLQRAEALYREVQVGSSEGGQGGGSPAAEDLADLFGLELDKLRNQYETVQRGAREEAQREVDQVMDQLRDLARRQQLENERLRREMAGQRPPAGDGGQGQRQLAQQTEEAARRLERLARERSRADLMDAARRLQQAAEEMRRSAAGGSQGAASAQAAMDRLREAERRLQRQQSAGLREEVEDAQRRAERLAEEQRAIGQEMQRLATGGQGAEAEQRARELRERKDRQADEIGGVQRQLDRLASESAGDNPDAARSLREAARSIRENRLEERVRQSSQLGARPGASEPYVRRTEEAIAAGIDELRQRLDRAREAAERSAEPGTDDSLERARALARGLESMEQRTRAAQESQQSGRQPGGEPQEGEPQQGQPGGQQGQPGQQGGQRQGEQAGTGQRGGSEQGQPQGGGARRDAGSVSPGQGGPMNGSPEQVRQLRAEARQRLEQARELRDALQREGLDTGDLDAMIADLRRLDDARTYADWEELSHLQASLVDRVKRFEFSLRGQLRGAEQERVFLSGAPDVPEEYRRLVEEYYRALARERQR